jgi:hypothetical protein
MHPVARVSTNILIRITVRNKYFSCSILLCTTTTCFGPDRWPSSGKMYTKKYSWPAVSSLAGRHCGYIRLTRATWLRVLCMKRINWTLNERSNPLCGLVVRSSWLQIQSSRVRFPALQEFLRSSGSGTVSTQPREYNWGATWKKRSGSCLENGDYGHRRSAALTTRHPAIRKKLALTSPTSGGRSVGVVRSQTQATEFVF